MQTDYYKAEKSSIPIFSLLGIQICQKQLTFSVICGIMLSTHIGNDILDIASASPVKIRPLTGLSFFAVVLVWCRVIKVATQ